MNRLLQFAAVLFCAGALNAGTVTPLVEPAIESVVTGGFWQQGDVSGRYRVVVRNSGFEQIRSEVFLEWIRDGSGEAGPSLLYSVPVRELNESMDLSFGVPGFLFGADGIRLEAVNIFTLESRVFILTPLEGGEYHLEDEQGPE